jgi:hypothetical protein
MTEKFLHKRLVWSLNLVAGMREGEGKKALGGEISGERTREGGRRTGRFRKRQGCGGASGLR